MSWECPDCKFDNHEMRSKCRNCKKPRDDKSKEPKELGEKKMALSAWTCVFCAYSGNDDLHLNCVCCQQIRADRLLQPHEFERICAHDRAMQEERDRAARTRYCAITDEMVPVTSMSGAEYVPIVQGPSKKKISRGPIASSKTVNARKLIEAIMDRMEQDQAFHKGVMIELAVMHGCEAETGGG